MTSPSQIIQIVADFYHLQPSDITGRSRLKSIARARNACMWLMKMQEMSYAQIGAALGRDHSTAMHGVLAARKIFFADTASDFDRGQINTLIEKVIAAQVAETEFTGVGIA